MAISPSATITLPTRVPTKAYAMSVPAGPEVARALPEPMNKPVPDSQHQLTSNQGVIKSFHTDRPSNCYHLNVARLKLALERYRLHGSSFGCLLGIVSDLVVGRLVISRTRGPIVAVGLRVFHLSGADVVVKTTVANKRSDQTL